MSDGAFHIGGYEHGEHEPRFDIAAEIAIETGKWLAEHQPPLETAEIPKSLLRREQQDYDARDSDEKA